MGTVKRLLTKIKATQELMDTHKDSLRISLSLGRTAKAKTLKYLLVKDQEKLKAYKNNLIQFLKTKQEGIEFTYSIDDTLHKGRLIDVDAEDLKLLMKLMGIIMQKKTHLISCKPFKVGLKI